MVQCQKCGQEFERNEKAPRKQVYCRRPECLKGRVKDALDRTKAKKEAVVAVL